MPEDAKRFQATRKHHSNEAAEDYTELIADLEMSHGEARTCEIAKKLGISHVTAIKTLKRLQKEGLIITAPHKPVRLTAKGKKLATDSKEKHQILLRFLLAIGVPNAIAEIDVEGMEHHMSTETVQALKSQLEKINSI